MPEKRDRNTSVTKPALPPIFGTTEVQKPQSCLVLQVWRFSETMSTTTVPNGTGEAKSGLKRNGTLSGSSRQIPDVSVPSQKLHAKASLAPTCGLRSLACLHIVIFHVAWYGGLGLRDRHAFDTALGENTWLTFIFNPELGMQAFLCLTGFLAAMPLIPALEKTESYTQTLIRYYKKRFLRIVPAYLAMLLFVRAMLVPLANVEWLWLGKHEPLRQGFFGPLAVFDLGFCSSNSMMLRNVFFVNNQLPAGGCFMISWSLAIQMQFWCCFPLVLLILQPQKTGFRTRLATTLLGVIGGVLAYRAWQLEQTRLWHFMPFQVYAPYGTEGLDLILFLGAHSYLGTLVRLTPLCFGALAALVVLDPATMRAISRRSKLANAVWVCLALVNLGGCLINKLGGARDAAHILANPAACTFAFICITGFLSPMWPATTLVLTTTKQPGISAAVAKLFSSAFFNWFATITYDIYLSHSLVMLGIFYVLPPTVWLEPPHPQLLPFVLMACLAIMLSTVTGWTHKKLWDMLLPS